MCKTNVRYLNLLLLVLCFGSTGIMSQIVGPYTGIDHATAYTNPAAGPACGSIAAINATLGDADFVNGTAEVPLGWSFSGTWASGATYLDGPGNEVLLVSLHTYTESWNVALRLSDGTTTAFLPYDLTIVTSDGTGSLTTCGGVVFGFTYERPCQELDFASYAIPAGEGVIGIVFEPFSDGAGNPDPHGVLILEGTPIDPGCSDLVVTATDTIVCFGDPITLDATSATGGTITWDGGILDDVAFTPPLGATTYTATSSDEDDCLYSIDILVNPLPTVTANSDDNEVCFGTLVTFTGGGAATYTWDSGIVNGVPFNVGAIGLHTYTVTGTSADGCVNTDDITISVINCEPIFAGFLMDNGICVGDCLTLTDTSTGGTIVAWDWDFGGAATPGTSTEVSPTICLNTVGSFTIQLTITSAFGETSTASKTLNVFALPSINVQLDTIIDLGGYANLIANSLSTGTYSWMPENDVACPTCGITTADPIDSTVYSVHFIDENGCTADGNVLVLVNFIESVGVPTAFSPNGDGINDILFIKGYGIAALQFVVYNRYGEVVFETTNQNIGWDGTFKNRDENPGVFTWVLQYDFVTGNKGMQKGNTTLIR